jgi:glycosyltransferase involved in cell wall biosynthesis
MRISLHSDHCYPIEDGHGVGIALRHEPSGAPQHIHDLIARGLGELGHEVFYYTAKGSNGPAPEGVTLCRSPRTDVDVLHNFGFDSIPSIRTQHRVREIDGSPDHCVYVSRSLAGLHGSNRFVRNGLDPEDYIYSETKDDYLLFLAGMQGNFHHLKYKFKGLDVALSLASSLGFKLLVAGTARDQEILDTVIQMCEESGATFLGDVRGRAKAELLAGARALLFPTQIHEGMPLVIVEALFSGTPVIASHHGPCPEVVTPEVGFVCNNFEEYAAAVSNLDAIQPRDCRAKAFRDHHYLAMAASYVKEYEIEIGRSERRA